MKIKNMQLISEINIEDIPWNLLSTPYGRGDEFPQWFQMLASDSKEEANCGVHQLQMHMEHQSTLWAVTPFGMVVLQKMLREAVNKFKSQSSESTLQLILNILDIYIPVFEAAQEVWQMEHAAPLPLITDMLQKECLLPEAAVHEDNENEDEEDEDDEDAILEDFYDSISEELFFSYFYYSWMILYDSLMNECRDLADMNNPEVSRRLKFMSDSDTINFFGKLFH